MPKAGPGLGLGALALALWATGAPSPPARAQFEDALRPSFNQDAYEAAREAFAELPEADRIAIQEALVWTGDYVSTADGVFGRRTFEAIQSYQARIRQRTTGILDRAALKGLLAAGARARVAAAFEVVADRATGIQIGIPTKYLTKRSTNPNGGSRFQSADGRVTLDTRSYEGGESELADAFERNLAIQTPGRVVSYKLSRPHYYVVSGETAGGKFYTRFATDDQVIRGFSIGYDKTLAGEYDRIVIAIANSFTPFPDRRGRAAPPIAARETPPVRPPSPRAAFTGLALGPARVVTALAATEACREPSVENGPARVVASDRQRGLALLEPVKPRAASPIRFAAASPTGTGLVMFVPAEPGAATLASPAEFVGPDQLLAPLQKGAAGGVALDRTGAVVGVVARPALGARKVAGLLPPARHGYVPADQVASLAGVDVAAAAPPSQAAASAGALAEALRANVVRVSCPGTP